MMNRKNKQTLEKIRLEMNEANENLQLPDSLSTSSVVKLAKRSAVNQNPQHLDSPRNVRPLYRITAMAATLAIVMGCALGISIIKESQMDIAGDDVIVGEIRNARNYDEIKQIFLGQANKLNNNDDENEGGKPSKVTPETATDVPVSSGVGATSAAVNPWHDEELIDGFEYDGSVIVKSDGEYIYMASKASGIIPGRESPRVVIMRANTIDSMQTVTNIDLPVVDDAKVEDSIIGLRLTNGKLIVVVKRLLNRGTANEQTKTVLYLYNVTDKKTPVLERELIQDGKFVDLLISDGKLYTVSNYTVLVDAKNIHSVDSLIPSYSDNGVLHLFGAQQIYCGVTDPDSSYLIITTADITNAAAPLGARAILGCDSKIYFSKNTFVATRRYTDKSASNIPEQYTELYCFAVTKDGIEFKGSNVVEGISSDLISVDEYDGSIKIAAKDTVGKKIDESVYIFSDKMEKISRYSRVD